MPADSDLFYDTLAAALRDRVAIIADHAARDRDPAAHLDRLKTVSQQIATLSQNLPADASPQLAHFLERCSYDKALALLDARQSP